MKELYRFAIVVALIALAPSHCLAFGKKTHYVPAPITSPFVTPSVTSSPIASPEPSPAPSPSKLFVKLGSDLGTSVDVGFAQKTLTLMNTAYQNGCLRTRIEAHRFVSLNTVFDVSPKTQKAAADEYLAGAPYALDLRWYYKSSKVVGYTYNFRDDDWNGASETRIWSNTRFIGDDPAYYAAHLAHELSHQARAGGFVHYTVFGGSFPYDVGDIMEACVRNL